MNEEALGKKIKALRISNGLTQIQVAQALGVTPALKDRIFMLTDEKKEKLMKTLDIWVD